VFSIGVVLRRADGLYFAEASLSGVKIRPLSERLARSNSHEIAVRKVRGVARTPEVRDRIESFVKQLENRPYETNLLVLFNAAVENRAKAQGYCDNENIVHIVSPSFFVFAFSARNSVVIWSTRCVN
jgi:hypothetical protein